MTRAALLLLLHACAPAGDDSAAPALADLTGLLLDPYAGDAPVEGAWIVVDDAGSVVSTRSAADGWFTIPDLPADVPLTLSVLAEDRVGITVQGFVIAEHALPVTLTGCTLRDENAYTFPSFGVEGTLSGAPDGSYVLLYGEDDYHDYVSGDAEAAVPFGFDARVTDGGDTYRFSAYAIDADYATLGVGLAEVDAMSGDVTDLDLALTPAADLSPLAVDLDRPTLDGTPLASIPAESCIYAASAFPGLDDGVVTGWAATCADTADGFHVELSYLPGGDDHVSVYASPDVEVATYAYAIVPIDSPALTVDLLDSPHLANRPTWGPGAVASWDPVEGVGEYLFATYDALGTAWLVYTGDGVEATFPTVPEGVPLPALAGDAAWMVYARDYAILSDGTLDASVPYRLSATAGGSVSW